MSKIVEAHLPCPKCPSSDAYTVYDDGFGHCFSCGGNFKDGEGRKKPVETKDKKVKFIEGEVIPIKSRKLSEETCKKWKYEIGEGYHPKTKELETCHIANYYERTPEGIELKGQKLRFADKQMTWVGHSNSLYGKWLWEKGKYIVITTGELDALSFSEATGNKYPVVSIPHGDTSAEAVIKAHLKWLEDNFENIVLMFDGDKSGQDAAKKVAPLFTPGRCRIANMSEKDASDMLVAGKIEELVKAPYNAKTYRPDGIVTLEDVRGSLSKTIESGYSYPFQTLTDLTFGARKQELVTLGAGTGMGKTELFKEIIVHFRTEHNLKVGVIFLEETNARTSLNLAGKIMNKPIHRPDCPPYEEIEKEIAIDKLQGDQSLVFYNHFGYMDYESIKKTIRHMVVVMGCDFIFLDHVTALVSGDKDGDDRKMLDYICTDLASMIRELNFGLFMISHLATPEGAKSHEEGARVQLKHLRGSRAIGQWSSFVFALERNQQDDTQEGITTLRVLKDRETGQATGKTFRLLYEKDTGRLKELVGDYSGEFEQRGGESESVY